MDRVVDIFDDAKSLVLHFRYDAEILAAVRTIPERTWLPERKKWIAPLQRLPETWAALEKHHFRLSPRVQELLTSQGQGAPREMPPTPPTDTLSVSQLNERVREVLHGQFAAPLWVCGELQGMERSTRQSAQARFFELVERRGHTPSESFRVDCVLFEAARGLVARRLAEAPEGLELRDGLMVRLKVRVGLYAPTGQYRLSVEDIDPAFTSGEIALNRERILRQLVQEGIARRNRLLPDPACPLRVALLASRESDGYRDFVHHLSASGFAFDLTALDIRVQGAQTEPSVLRALQWVQSRAAQFDVAVIVRGGGSRSDLAHFDTLAIGRAACLLPVKLVCGVGHQRDICLLDDLAHSTKTPTDAAQWLVDRVAGFRDALLGQMQAIALGSLRRLASGHHQTRHSAARLVRLTERTLHGRTLELAQTRSRVRERALGASRKASGLVVRRQAALGHALRWCLERERQGVARALAALEQERLARRLHGLERELQGQWRLVLLGAPARMRSQREQLELMEARLRLLDPQQVLRRGYALVLGPDGRAARDPGELAPDALLRVRLSEGTMLARRVTGAAEPE